jgi:radical SAM protein with 4Fe4S-binding SPASM domain
MPLGVRLLLRRELLMRETAMEGSEQETYSRIESFIASTRGAVFVRRADNLLMIRPDKTLGINRSAAVILDALYRREAEPRSTRAILEELAPRLGTPRERLLKDSVQLVQAVGALLNEDFSPRPSIRMGTFDRGRVRFPTLAEIALTYGCQNRCAFCYAASPHREGEHRPMTTDEVMLVMEKIFHQAHVPSLSFTGGEATLRPDLPRLVRHGERLGFRVNLITNGIRAAEPGFAAGLVEAGLASAQVSLEAGEAELHDGIVGRRGAFAQTVEGIRRFQQLGIHVHTNTTLCAANLDSAPELIRFVARELGLATLSMNMVIRTGVARGAGSPMEVSYSEIGRRIPGLLELARTEGVKLVWYSPIPYCIFNPVLHDLGAKSCACVDGILSVDPEGQVLPCSSFASGIGSLLKRSFSRIYRSRAAKYWRHKRFAPPLCRDCPDLDLCGGGCPLYWDAAGSFAELPGGSAADPRQRLRWERDRRRGRSFGVPAPPDATSSLGEAHG